MKKIISTLLVSLLILLPISSSYAASTTPDIMMYEGKLLDTNGAAVTTEHSLRISFWTNADYITGDVALGVIDSGAANYGGWQEVQTITPNSNGIFSVELGSETSLPTIDFDSHKYLQVEIKASADAITEYELLDSDSSSDTIDRQTIGSLPYSKNSEAVGGKSVGTSEDELAVLGTNGKWSPAQIPDNVYHEIFTLDSDNTIETAGTGTIDLNFGDTLNKVLSYDIDNSQFDFNDSVNIQGDLNITGTFTTSLGFSWDNLAVRNKTISLFPYYSGMTVSPDGTENQVTLRTGKDSTNDKHYYCLTSNESSLQDLDLNVRVRLPDDFVDFQATPIQIDIKTNSISPDDNQIDVFIKDTTGADLSLMGGTDIVSSIGNVWQQNNITFLGSPTWNAGEVIDLRIHLESTSSNEVYIGDMQLNYQGK